MTSATYICCDEERRSLLMDPAAPAGLTGIDYIEVDAGTTTADPTLITVVLVKPLDPAPADLTADNVLLEGGVRFPSPKIDPVITSEPGGGTLERYRITVPGNQPTDFSTYRLTLVESAGSADPPKFIDVRLASVDFSFKIGCPSDFDCAPDCGEIEDALPADPQFDYRLRDYQGFRRQMLDRLAILIPDFKQDDPVDFTITLLEALAYRADQQSYRLDWVGTEAFFSTARSRTSVARHARLVDYSPDEGASARLFVQLTINQATGPGGFTIPAGTPVAVKVEGFPSVVRAGRYRKLLEQAPLIFETAAPLILFDWHNAIPIHTWGDGKCVLPAGSTAATLVDLSDGLAPLQEGDLLLFRELKWQEPVTGLPEPGRLEKRHVVRLTRVSPATDQLSPPPAGSKLMDVEWSSIDALPFDLAIQLPPDPSATGADPIIAADAAANIMIADHGLSLPPAPMLGLVGADVEALRPRLDPSGPIAGERWRPLLNRGDIARVAAFGPVEGMLGADIPAASLALIDPSAVLPALRIDDPFSTWTARRDLLDSSPFDRDFVIETEISGRAALRFGDDVNGLMPEVGAELSPRGRFGVGPPGNIGIGALAHVVLADGGPDVDLIVTNPLAGSGGGAPESLDQVRISAPFAFRRQERAVAAKDYADAAKQHPEVQDAVAAPRWTGAWQTILVYLDRKGGLSVDAPFRRTMLDYLERFRLMGFDVAVAGAKALPLDIELMICAKASELKSSVAARVRDALRPAGPPGGPPGFFNPDNFSFGSPLYLSALIAAVMKVEGVESVTARKFQPLGRLPQDELLKGVIHPGMLEVLKLDDDPSFPENGRLAIAIGGGR